MRPLVAEGVVEEVMNWFGVESVAAEEVVVAETLAMRPCLWSVLIFVASLKSL